MSPISVNSKLKIEAISEENSQSSDSKNMSLNVININTNMKSNGPELETAQTRVLKTEGQTCPTPGIKNRVDFSMIEILIKIIIIFNQ
jgi:hypothetical protein